MPRTLPPDLEEHMVVVVTETHLKLKVGDVGQIHYDDYGVHYSIRLIRDWFSRADKTQHEFDARYVRKVERKDIVPLLKAKAEECLKLSQTLFKNADIYQKFATPEQELEAALQRAIDNGATEESLYSELESLSFKLIREKDESKTLLDMEDLIREWS